MKKNITRKVILIFIIIGMVIEIVSPVIAKALNYQNCNSISVGGNPTMNGNNYEYENGNITVTKNGTAVNLTTISVKQNDQIVINFMPNDTYMANLKINGDNIVINNNIYSFTIGQENDNAILLLPSFNKESESLEIVTYDFTINGKSFTNVKDGDKITVSNDFDVNRLDEFYVTKIVTSNKTYNYSANEYSLSMLNSEGNKILESHFDKKSVNFALFRCESHSDKILDKDIAQGKTKSDYYGFYLVNVSFLKSDFAGIKVSTEHMPDFYDFTQWNGVDISVTSQNNPGKITVYYDDDVINFSGLNKSISKIELIIDKGVPQTAVTINDTLKTVKVNSNYYNEIPVKITTEDNIVGYITITRIGIFVETINAGNDTFYHGAFNTHSNHNLSVDTDKNRIVAAFYHGVEETYSDYDLVANIIYEDGTTETKIATGVSDTQDENEILIGSNYILLTEENHEKKAKRIFITVINKNAISNSSSFGGATFGSGAGVEWIRNERD